MRHIRLPKILSFRNIAVFFFVANFLVFLAYPIAKAFAGSLHYWNPMTGAYDWVGLENFEAILKDPLFWRSIWNTFYFSFFAVIFRIALGLGVAVMLYSQLAKCKTVFRALFYMPTITPLVAVSLVWVWMYDPQFGLIDKLFGIHVNWLNNPKWALPAIIIMTIWKDFGYATVLYLAALMNVPTDVLEASQIDGANSWQRFWRIIMPLIRPATVFVFITSLITYFQAYVQILMMTEGGPGDRTYTISYLIYDRAFVNYDFGTASAMSIVLFLITGVLSFLSLRLSTGKE
ncbi:carbohydrate ABC transporter permease [Bifidobacterium longum]|uniref:carbohydrate ABC transporter permease n=1 Tax=Bifidobacterium longum TaxID=216816 RepID=UPI0032193BC3|nr:sugar ABC transporter permease [Bifidobacterium longum]MDB6588552.1 sugar ABC transporter permease [Bifidobacterium longum]MDB6590851.1 sugar ABC transporter permease [Bifidobacterium longum]